MKELTLEKDILKPTQKSHRVEFWKKKHQFMLSNVMILDPKSNEPTRIGARIILDEKTGKKKIARVSKVSGEMIP